MLKVGLTGGIACGKTFVAEALAGFGCLVIHADELGHEVLAPGGEAYDPVVREFGGEILTPEGAIDRRALAECLGCAWPAQRAVHPADQREAIDRAFREREPHERGGGGSSLRKPVLPTFHKLILGLPGRSTGRAGAAARGASEADVLARIGRQMRWPKRKFADFVKDTSGKMEPYGGQAVTHFTENGIMSAAYLLGPPFWPPALSSSPAWRTGRRARCVGRTAGCLERAHQCRWRRLFGTREQYDITKRRAIPPCSSRRRSSREPLRRVSGKAPTGRSTPMARF